MGLSDLDQASSFVYRHASCELCKAPYPLRIGNTPLVELPDIPSPFVALDVNDRKHSGLHVLSLADSLPLGIGRTSSCAVRVHESSLSRCHATIRCNEAGDFVIADNNSKFGTTIAVKAQIKLEVGAMTSFKVGSTVLRLWFTEVASEDCEGASGPTV
jgi:hypothetical protein